MGGTGYAISILFLFCLFAFFAFYYAKATITAYFSYLDFKGWITSTLYEMQHNYNLTLDAGVLRQLNITLPQPANTTTIGNV